MLMLTPTQRNLGKFASLLGIIQGLAWAVMSLICIILYIKEDLPKLDDHDSYSDYFNNLVYVTYLYKKGSVLDSRIVTPEAFTVFMWIYFLTSLVWVTISIFLLHFIARNKVTVLIFMRSWGIVTCLTSLVDFFLVVFIGTDYDKVCLSQKYLALVQRCTTSMIPVLVLAARGFLLWIINVIFVYITYRIVRDVKGRMKLNEKLLTDRQPIPRATLQPPQNPYNQPPPRVNGGQNYWGDNPKSGFESRSLPHNPAYSNSQGSYGRY